MSLIPRDPFRALRRRDDTFEDFVREFFGRTEGAPDHIEPPVEVAESDGDVVVKMVVPGVDKDQIQISVANNVLSARGEVRKEKEEKKKNFYRQEIRYGAFERQVPLPAEVEGAKATANLKNGMLTITLPKTKPSKATQINVAAQ